VRIFEIHFIVATISSRRSRSTKSTWIGSASRLASRLAMKKIRSSSSSSSKKSFTRRGALKGAAKLASFAAVGTGCGSAGISADGLDQNAGNVGGRKRVAVVGGGAGGIATAYFLEGVCDVEIFEARDKIGGHCDSQTIDYQGQPITVDLGAQFF